MHKATIVMGADGRTDDGDGDRDGTGQHDSDDRVIVDYGHAADAVDERAIIGLVERYMSATAIDDGHAACRLLHDSVAHGSDLLKAIPLPYTPGSQSPMRRAVGCPEVMSLLFKQSRRHQSGKLGVLHITSVRIKGSSGLVTFTEHAHAEPEEDIAVAREGQSWKISTLLAARLP